LNFWVRHESSNHAQLIDGNALSRQLRTEVTARVSALKTKGITPGLAVILVGENPASQVYVRNKEMAAGKAGLAGQVHRLPKETTQAELEALVHALNADPAIDGILVQLPLPKHIDEHAILVAIAPEKDVDGFHPDNVAKLNWIRGGTRTADDTIHSDRSISILPSPG